VNEDELAELLESGRRPDGGLRPQANDAAERLHDLLGDESVWAEPEPGGLDVLLASISAEATGRPVAPPASGGAAHLAARRARRRSAHAGGAGRGRMLVLSAAAALVVVAGVAGVLVATSGDDGAGREVALSGTPLSPDASAQAMVEVRDAGVAIGLADVNLPGAPPGSYYQGWVKGDSGLVTVGTFHLRGDDDDIELWSGVDLEDYPMLTITIQEEGAGQESSGQVVLSGRIAP
jgi:hypothetical protein